MVFLLVALCDVNTDWEQKRIFPIFIKLYNMGLSLLSVTMLVRGVVQALGVEILKEVHSTLSGVAGIGHIYRRNRNCVLLLVLRKSTHEDV
ncbi:DUF2871 family protein [Aerococcus christensenii]|uniref:DUF2871 family protein n=1 Tax=Aerococcus christensenii TaxID=87541 RepID=UPI003B849858